MKAPLKYHTGTSKGLWWHSGSRLEPLNKIQHQVITIIHLVVGSILPAVAKRLCLPDEFFYPEHSPLYAWLCVGVVVLDAIKELAETPVAVSLNI